MRHPGPIGGGLGDEAIVEAAGPECIVPGQTPPIKLLGLKAFKDTIDLFVERYRDQNVSVMEGEVISEEYSLEYGTDIMEMHVRAVQAGERALIIDDLIATGGTLCAAIKLLGKLVNVNALSTKKKLAGLQLLQQ